MKTRHHFAGHGESSTAARLLLSGSARKTQPQPKRTWDYHAVVLVVRGAGFFEDARNARLRCGAGDAFFLFPGIWHTYGPGPGELWEEVFLVFSGPILEAWQQAGWLPISPPLHRTGQPEHWHRRLASVPAPRTPDTPSAQRFEACRLQAVLAELLQGGAGARHQENAEWARQVGAVMEQAIHGAPDWARIAARFGQSPETFRKRFARVFGCSPAKYLARMRINRACDLLAQPAATNRSVAESIGFCDEFYFARSFKKIIGMPPGVFRRQLCISVK